MDIKLILRMFLKILVQKNRLMRGNHLRKIEAKDAWIFIASMQILGPKTCVFFGNFSLNKADLTLKTRFYDPHFHA